MDDASTRALKRKLKRMRLPNHFIPPLMDRTQFPDTIELGLRDPPRVIVITDDRPLIQRIFNDVLGLVPGRR